MNKKRQQKNAKVILPDSLALGMAAVIATVVVAALAEPPTSDIVAAVTIQAGTDWIPLPYDPWIEPGSALDFSSVLPHHAPAGKFGRAVAVGDHFEFEGLPGVSQRFYGVNLCNTVNLPSSPEAAAPARRPCTSTRRARASGCCGWRFRQTSARLASTAHRA